MNEIWKPVLNFEGWYEVSNFGRLRRAKSGSRTFVGKVLKLYTPKGGYTRTVLSKNHQYTGKLIHRLVAEVFCDRKNGEREVNHLNGIKNDNKAENLEWVTTSENQKHAIKIGLKKFKLSNKQVTYIKEFLNTKKPYKQIAKEFGVDRGTVRKARDKGFHIN